MRRMALSLSKGICNNNHTPSTNEDCRAVTSVSEVKAGLPLTLRTTTRHASMKKYYYVYILQSLMDTQHYYTGFTEDMKARLEHHNSGGDPFTSRYRPWEIKTVTAFTDRSAAIAFERYLKTSSGRAFAKKRL